MIPTLGNTRVNPSKLQYTPVYIAISASEISSLLSFQINTASCKNKMDDYWDDQKLIGEVDSGKLIGDAEPRDELLFIKLLQTTGDY